MFTFLGVVLVLLGLSKLVWPRAGYAFNRNVFGVDQSRLVTDWALHDGWMRFLGGFVLLVGLGFLLWGGPDEPSTRGRAAFSIPAMEEDMNAQWITDTAAAQSLRAAGESPTKKRNFEFSASLATAAHATVFVEAARLSGFLDGPEAPPGPSGTRVYVRVVKETDLDQIVQTAFGFGLLVRHHGGYYEGWK